MLHGYRYICGKLRARHMQGAGRRVPTPRFFPSSQVFQGPCSMEHSQPSGAGCFPETRRTNASGVNPCAFGGFPSFPFPSFFSLRNGPPDSGDRRASAVFVNADGAGNWSGMTRTLMAPKSSVRFRRMGRVLCVVSHFAHIFRVSLHQRPFPFPSRRPLVPELASIHPHLPDEASLGISVMPICHGFVSPDANRIHCG